MRARARARIRFGPVGVRARAGEGRAGWPRAPARPSDQGRPRHAAAACGLRARAAAAAAAAACGRPPSARRPRCQRRHTATRGQARRRGRRSEACAAARASPGDSARGRAAPPWPPAASSSASPPQLTCRLEPPLPPLLLPRLHRSSCDVRRPVVARAAARCAGAAGCCRMLEVVGQHGSDVEEPRAVQRLASRTASMNGMVVQRKMGSAIDLWCGGA